MKKPRKFQLSTDASAVTFAVLIIVLLGAILLPLPRSIEMPPRAFLDSPGGNLQEELGYLFTALTLADLERNAGLRTEWEKIIHRMTTHETGRAGALQERLGLAIARTAQDLWMKERRLRRDLAEARDALRRFHEGREGRRQEKLGLAVVAAYRRTSGIGPDFQAAFELEANRQARMEQRIGRRLEETLAILTERQARFPETVVAMHDEAVRSAHRSARMMYESRLAWERRWLDDVQTLLARERTPEQYLSLAKSVRAVLSGPGVVTGYVEFGMPALAGLLAIMAWLVLSIRLDPLFQHRSAETAEHIETDLHNINTLAELVR